MIAIDTNIVVRLLTRDEPEQYSAVKALIEREQVFVSTTVLIETHWVLRSTFGLDREAVANAIGAFASMPNVVLEDRDRISFALEAAAKGVEFDDALHLAAARDCEAMITFDRKFIKAARSVDGAAVRLP